MDEQYPENERRNNEFVYGAESNAHIGIAEEHLNKVICKCNTCNCSVVVGGKILSVCNILYSS